MESMTGRPSPLTKAPARRKLSHRSSEHDCKSQDCVGEIGTGIRVGKRSENTDFWQETARRIIRISPTQSWDLHPGLHKGRETFGKDFPLTEGIATIEFPHSEEQLNSASCTGHITQDPAIVALDRG